MNKQHRMSLDDLLSLSIVEFFENFEKNISKEFKRYQEIMDEQAKIDIIEEDDSMQYAYNKELPYIF